MLSIRCTTRCLSVPCCVRQAREAEKRKKQEEEEAAKKAFNYVKPVSSELGNRSRSIRSGRRELRGARL